MSQPDSSQSPSPAVPGGSYPLPATPPEPRVYQAWSSKSFFKRLVRLSVGPEGIVSNLTGAPIPWSEVKGIRGESFSRPDESTYNREFSYYLTIDLLPKRGRPNQISIYLNSAIDAKPDQAYRDVLHAFTRYSSELPERLVYRKDPWLSLIPRFVIAAGITCLLYFFIFSYPARMLKSPTLMIAMAVAMIMTTFLLVRYLGTFAFFSFPEIGTIRLQFGPRGISGTEVKGGIPWSDVKDVDIVRKIYGDLHLAVSLVPGSPSAARFDPPVFPQRDTLALDLQVAGPELMLERINEARDALMAFGRYSGSEAAKDVPARLDTLFRC